MLIIVNKKIILQDTLILVVVNCCIIIISITFVFTRAQYEICLILLLYVHYSARCSVRVK